MQDSSLKLRQVALPKAAAASIAPQNHRLLCWLVHQSTACGYYCPFPVSLLLWGHACTSLALCYPLMLWFSLWVWSAAHPPQVNTSSKSLLSLDNELGHKVFQTWVHRILGSCPGLMTWELFIHASQVTEAKLMTPDWEVGRNILNHFYGVESRCSNYIQVHELIQCLAAPAAEAAHYTITAGTKALLATIPCLNIGHRCPSPGNFTQPLCSLPRAQFPSRHCSVPSFPWEETTKYFDFTLHRLDKVFSKSLLTPVTPLTDYS